VVSAGAYPTSIIWNFDKPLAGLLLLGWGIPRAYGWSSWKHAGLIGLGYGMICVALMAAGALALGAVAWAPKFTAMTATFAVGNLLLVCVAEEAFFRGVVQRGLGDAWSAKKYGRGWSLSLAALFFGICHVQGGIGLIVVATVAGLFYGAAYQRSGRVEAAILCHFMLNVTHFALFTYPALRVQ
jgi:uncharacterized protein